MTKFYIEPILQKNLHFRLPTPNQRKPFKLSIPVRNTVGWRFEANLNSKSWSHYWIVPANIPANTSPGQICVALTPQPFQLPLLDIFYFPWNHFSLGAAETGWQEGADQLSSPPPGICGRLRGSAGILGWYYSAQLSFTHPCSISHSIKWCNANFYLYPQSFEQWVASQSSFIGRCEKFLFHSSWSPRSWVQTPTALNVASTTTS